MNSPAARVSRLFYRYMLLIFSIIGIDRITKFIMRELQEPYVVNDYVSFTLHYNRGISWSMFHSESTLVFTILTTLIALCIFIFGLYAFVRYHNNFGITCELMVCAGAFSNLIDRLLYGGVVDFIMLSYKGWSWPVFNIADTVIVLGLIGMILIGYFSNER